jgi:hypothetical protein
MMSFLWFISMLVIGVVHAVWVCTEPKQIRLWNILLGIYHFPITILFMIGFGLYWVCAKSKLSERLNKVYFDWR